MFRLKELRLENGMTRSSLARALELPATTVANYENETRQAPYELLIRLADFSASAWTTCWDGRTISGFPPGKRPTPPCSPNPSADCWPCSVPVPPWDRNGSRNTPPSGRRPSAGKNLEKSFLPTQKAPRRNLRDAFFTVNLKNLFAMAAERGQVDEGCLKTDEQWLSLKTALCPQAPLFPIFSP